MIKFNPMKMGMGAFIAFVLLIIIIFIAAVNGWIHNLIFVMQMTTPMGQMTASQIIHIVGIPLVPVGAVAGYFG